MPEGEFRGPEDRFQTAREFLGALQLGTALSGAGRCRVVVSARQELLAVVGLVRTSQRQTKQCWANGNATDGDAGGWSHWKLQILGEAPVLHVSAVLQSSLLRQTVVQR